MRRWHWLALLLTFLFLLVTAVPAFAKGGGFSGGSRGGFSSGGSRGGFSSSGSRGFSSSRSVSPSGGTTGSGGWSSGTSRSFSTPSTSSSRGWTLGRSYSSGPGSYSSGSGSYSSGKDYGGVNGVPSGTSRSFNTTPRSTYTPTMGEGRTNSPYYGRPPVVIFSNRTLPYDPWYYHSWYWGMPWYYRMFWSPTYYYTPWGYHYFEPNYFAWTVVGLGGLFAGLWLWGWWRMRRW